MNKKIEPKYITKFEKRLFQQSKTNPNAIVVDGKEIELDPEVLNSKEETQRK